MAIFGSSDRLTPVGQVFVPPSITLMKEGSAATSFSAAARDVRLDALAMGTYDDLCRACVDCGIKTGSYCDGKWGVHVLPQFAFLASSGVTVNAPHCALSAIA